MQKRKRIASYPNRTSDLVITSDTPYHLIDISGSSAGRIILE